MENFFNKLESLGFEIDTDTKVVVNKKKELPRFITALSKNQIIDFDMRELLASGKDSLTLILDKIKSVREGEALKVINTFEPIPLIKMLEKQGFEVYADITSHDLVETYFYKKSNESQVQAPSTDGSNDGWDGMMQQFIDKLVTVDVRQLEMPQPMMTIL